jgi:hypothetical protein
MDVKWDEVVVRRSRYVGSEGPAPVAGAVIAPEGRKRMLEPDEMVYKVEEGYKGAHYDHFGNFFNAIRNGGSVVEDPVFGFRAAAPALLCNESYSHNSFIRWDPVNMKKL